MYSDIIPPRKKNSIRNISMDRLDQSDPEEEKVYLPVSSSPRKRSVPKFLLFLLIGLLLIGGIIYAKFIEHTTITFTSKTTTLEINEKISLTPQKDTQPVDAADTLSYSLIYISAKNSARNPFLPQPSSTTSSTSSTLAPKLVAVEIVATTTGATTSVYLINETKDRVPLRATTRFDVKGVIYSLTSSTNVGITPNASAFSNKEKYYLPGFKGSASAELIYAVPVNGGTIVSAQPADNTGTPDTSSSGPTTALVPSDILSLLPDTSVALKKNTIYDTLLDQAAVVVFDKKDLLAALEKNNPSMAEYIKSFEPVNDMISYTVEIIDYEMDVSAESGRPVAFKKLIIEITPVLDIEQAKRSFVNFSMETMEKISTQMSSYATLKTRATPFWNKEVAGEGKVEVRVESN